MSDSSLTFHCTRCGGGKFAMPDQPADDDIITCSGCGAQGRYGDVKKTMLDLAKKHVDDVFSKSLGPLFKRR